MNDFTKEELAVIHLAIIRDINQFDHILKSSPSMIKLRDKLENMIDNYCEHEWNINELMKKIVLNPGEAFPVECKKCGLPYRC